MPAWYGDPNLYYWLQSANATTATTASGSVAWNATITTGTANWYPPVVTWTNGNLPTYPPQFWVNGQLYVDNTPVSSWRSGLAVSSWRHSASLPVRQPLQSARRLTLLRRENHDARRALRRSIELYARIRGRTEITRFVRGESVIIQGHRFRYKVKKRDDLLHHTRRPHTAHIPYWFELLDPANDNRALSSGCIVMDDTPVVDQLLALALAVQHPERELRVLRTTNWSPRLPPLMIEASDMRLAA